MRTLLIDNYDSYTYNLFQLLAAVNGIEPVVVRNDDPRWQDLDLRQFDGVVLSPGPGHPARHRDFGHSRRVLEGADLPVLGVCLGHQGIGLVAGGQVVSAPPPRHGHVSEVRHRGHRLFAGVPSRFEAVRYHSLCLAEPLPAQLEAIAWSEDDVLMAIAHRTLPRWGVQFHPESICTAHGATILANFGELAQALRPRGVARARPPGRATASAAATARAQAAGARHAAPPDSAAPPDDAAPLDEAAPPDGTAPLDDAAPLIAVSRCIELLADPEAVFLRLYGTSGRAFWLDSARVEAGRSRFSFMGSADGPGGEVLIYRVGDDSVAVEAASGAVRHERGTIFDVLQRRLTRRIVGAEQLPFPMTGGYVGYFGYELKALLGGAAAHAAETPDALWMRADRFLAFDHAADRTYVVALAEPGGEADARAWVEDTAGIVGDLPVSQVTAADVAANDLDVAPWLVRPRARYLAEIEECQHKLRTGESYEICLTNQIRLAAPGDDLAYYRRLRRLNPAPYAAFLKHRELAISCSSPERFLRIDAAGAVESKPIKGTAARAASAERDEHDRRRLAADPKARAENLMIVDLVRNDLGKVCEIGSVTVPEFLVTESYATVHQLVSTIRGTLRAGATALDCVKACFPGGSMTGAPKLRTMEILDALESAARGVYAGALGYLAFDGAADLNIVIRTAVRWRDHLSVGAGGAIVLDSDAEAEYEEMLLKARAPLRALPVVRRRQAAAS